MVVNYQLTKADSNSSKAWLASWELISLNEGAPFPSGSYLQKSIQVSGAFYGAKVLVQGSNDGEDYQTLTDSQGLPLEIKSSSIVQIQEAVAFIRPLVKGGDEETNLKVTLLVIGA